MNSVCQADLLTLSEELYQKKVINRNEKPLARMCLALLMVGVKKTTVRMLSEPCVNFNEYWENLERNGYFEGSIVKRTRTVALEDLDTDIPFILMMLCAEGKLKRLKEAGCEEA